MKMEKHDMYVLDVFTDILTEKSLHEASKINCKGN